ncbi:MAG: hypothetical protein CMF31_10495 [Kordiimonas sp.]|nr:hypothetical protein [Kordiimonas sp.]|tara:strand:- start:3558 stop:4388 length:831 start_codon:yes stop_codon:yes gene_type:complete
MSPPFPKGPAPVAATPASSVILIRNGRPRSDGFGRLEVLMVRRHVKIGVGGGAYVFPGGKVDGKDRNALPYINMGTRVRTSQFFEQARLTAFRETFEETGLLLAQKVGARGVSIEPPQQQQVARLYRWRFLQQHMSLRHFIEQTGLLLNVDQFLPFAHWITPITHRRRFDTAFFLCVAPHGQKATPDGHEITACLWARPIDILEQYWKDLMFPTMMNLQKLSRAQTVEEALFQLRRTPIKTVIPEVVSGEAGTFRRIRDDAGYEMVDQTGLHLKIK